MKQVDVNTSPIEIINTKVSQVCGKVMTLKLIFSCLRDIISNGKFRNKTSCKLSFYIFTNNTYTMYFSHSYCFLKKLTIIVKKNQELCRDCEIQRLLLWWLWQPLVVALTSLSSHPYYKVYIIIWCKSHARFCTCKILLQALTLTCKDFYIVHNRACSSRNQMPPVLDIALQDQVYHYLLIDIGSLSTV